MHEVEILFDGKRVEYETFVTDLSNRIAAVLRTSGSEVISQRKAEEMFGKANIRRWRDTGCIAVTRKKGKIEYPVARLRELSSMDEMVIQATMRYGDRGKS